jgi:hypothetical protein
MDRKNGILAAFRTVIHSLTLMKEKSGFRCTKKSTFNVTIGVSNDRGNAV